MKGMTRANGIEKNEKMALRELKSAVASRPTIAGIFVVCSECVRGYNGDASCESGGSLADRTASGCCDGVLLADLKPLFQRQYGAV